MREWYTVTELAALALPVLLAACVGSPEVPVRPAVPTVVSESPAAEFRRQLVDDPTGALKPGMPVGLFSEEVAISTDHPNPKQGPLKVLLSGKMIGPIGCYPEVLRMSQVQADKGSTLNAALEIIGRRFATGDYRLR